MKGAVALVAAAMLFAPVPQAQAGYVWLSLATANNHGPVVPLERQATHADLQKSDLRQAAEVRIRTDARPFGPPLQPPAIVHSPTADFPQTGRAASVPAEDHDAVIAPALPFHGRAPPRI